MLASVYQWEIQRKWGMAFYPMTEKLQVPPFSILKQNPQSDSIRNSHKAASHSKPGGTLWNSAFGFHSRCLVLLVSWSNSIWLTSGVLGRGMWTTKALNIEPIVNQGCSGPEPPWGLKGAQGGVDSWNWCVVELCGYQPTQKCPKCAAGFWICAECFKTPSESSRQLLVHSSPCWVCYTWPFLSGEAHVRTQQQMPWRSVCAFVGPMSCTIDSV